MEVLSKMAFIVFIISVPVCLIWCLYDKFIGQKLAMLKFDGITPRHLKEYVNQALKQLSCEPTWEACEDSNLCHFDYQGARFQASINKDISYVRLALYYVGNIPLEDINILRTICNHFAFAPFPVKATYSIDEKAHCANIHIISNMLINKINAKDLMKSTMAQMFDMQRELKAQMRTETEKAHKAECADIELASAEWSGELELLHELEINQQNTPFNGHETMVKPIVTPAEILSRIFGFNQCHITNMAAWADGEQMESPATADRLSTFPLYSLLVSNGKFVHSQATAEFTFCPIDSNTNLRLVSIHLAAEKTTPSVLYYRVTATLMPKSARFANIGKTADTAKCVSIVAGYELVPIKKQLDAIAYQWSEIRANANLQTPTATQRLLASCENPDMANLIGISHQRYLDRRFFEAIPALDTIYKYYTARFDQLSSVEKRGYYEVCYLLGSCHYHLGQFKEAHFYLFHTLPLNNIIYNEQYVNCIVSMDYCDALRFIDASLETLKQRIEMGQQNMNFLNFYYFLQRRKVEYLLNKHRNNEAETLLRSMLNGTPNSDFAIQKLADIQKMKQRT